MKNTLNFQVEAFEEIQSPLSGKGGPSKVMELTNRKVLLWAEKGPNFTCGGAFR